LGKGINFFKFFNKRSAEIKSRRFKKTCEETYCRRRLQVIKPVSPEPRSNRVEGKGTAPYCKSSMAKESPDAELGPIWIEAISALARYYDRWTMGKRVSGGCSKGRGTAFSRAVATGYRGGEFKYTFMMGT
jgi:hypothetical protein